MTYVMGGRKDDVKRTQKQHKKRPLSAVIEEHEADDSVPKTTTSNRVRNNNSNTPNDRKPTELAASSLRVPDNVEVSHNDSAPSGTAFSALFLHPPVTLTVTADGECGGADSSSITSANSPRRNSLRSGRRQALTPSFSPKMGRRSALTSRLSVQNEGTDSDDDTLSPTDMMRLRQTADRLHLSTRRPSVMQWRAQYVECPKFPLPGTSGNRDVTGQNGDEEGRWTKERTQRINTALDWIINELQEMRTQDQQLARQLLTIRSDLHQLKLARSCEEHQDMLDDVQSELEELQEFADVLDLPVLPITDSPLQHLGVTRMNFSARRFSTC